MRKFLPQTVDDAYRDSRGRLSLRIDKDHHDGIVVYLGIKQKIKNFPFSSNRTLFSATL